jgi:hypothetical protein
MKNLARVDSEFQGSMSDESGIRDGGLVGGCCNAERGIVPVVYVTQCKRLLLVAVREALWVLGF